MPPPTQQQGQTLWFSRFTNLIATSSVVRYGTLIFLVALISVLYFATTHQVMKTSGGNASVYSERMFVTNNPLSPDSNGDNKIVYDKSNQIGDIKSVNNNNVLGFLYDRGNGCFRYPNLNNTITSVIPPEIPTNFQSRRIGFILDDSSCSLDKQIRFSIYDNDIGLIIYSKNTNTNYDNNNNSIQIPVFTVSDSKLLDELNYIYNYDIKSNDSLQILRVQLLPPQPIPVNSWLFAMFAVGGILVTSFFISILIHMRLYRLRRNHQEEIRRQRTLLDDGTGMRKWTLDKDDIKSLRSFIYPKKTDASKKSTEISILTEIDEKNNSTLTNENSGDKSISSNENSKESTNIPRSLIHKSSIRSNRSTRSTKSTKSTRSQKAIINATSLSESTQNPIILDNRAESPSEDTELEETCAICLEDFDEGDNIRELPCRHWYHVECIDPWLTTKSSSCPLCKKDCKPSIGSESNENTSISVNNENESQGTQAVDVDSSSNSTNANAPNVVLRVGRWFRGYFSSRNGRGDSTRNVTTNSLQNENEIMELESVRSVN